MHGKRESKTCSLSNKLQLRAWQRYPMVRHPSRHSSLATASISTPLVSVSQLMSSLDVSFAVHCYPCRSLGPSSSMRIHRGCCRPSSLISLQTTSCPKQQHRRRHSLGLGRSRRRMRSRDRSSYNEYDRSIEICLFEMANQTTSNHARCKRGEIDSLDC